MRKLIFYLASSLDGYIADPEFGVEKSKELSIGYGAVAPRNHGLSRNILLLEKRIRVMKYFFSCLFLIASFRPASAQSAMTFQAGKEQGIEVKDLDADYPAPMGSDSVSAAIFGVEQDQYIKLYQ